MRHDNKLHFLKFDLKLASLQQSSIIDINPISEKVLIDNNDFNSIVYLDGDSKVVKARIFNR